MAGSKRESSVYLQNHRANAELMVQLRQLCMRAEGWCNGISTAGQVLQEEDTVMRHL